MLLGACRSASADSQAHAALPHGSIHIPAHNFSMGCPGGDNRCDEVEGVAPLHPVTLSAFAIDRTEVTQRAYLACVEAGRCSPAGCGGGVATREHPVACIDWYQAETYCRWDHQRLPTEAEWERAARGRADDRVFPWGDEEPTCALANSLDCGGSTWAVGSAPAGASPDGVLDMAGNVSEWTADWMAAEYYRSHPTPADPKGPHEGTQRVVRGGAFDDPAARSHDALSVSSRASAPPDLRLPSMGFRCAHSLR
jgi:formylglycine-generating enzyme required for sulfatase activity